MHDDGAVRVPGVLEDVALLEALAVHDGGVDGREGHVVDAGPLLRQQQLLQPGNARQRMSGSHAALQRNGMVGWTCLRGNGG